MIGDIFHKTDIEMEELEADANNNEDYMAQLKEEEEREKRKAAQREVRKEAFVKRYIMEKQWYKEELIKEEIERKKEQERMKQRMQQFTNEDQKSILEKYEQEDQEDEYFKPVTKYKGPTSERTVTNRKNIYLWTFLNLFFIATAFYVLTDGRPERLANGYDFRTELCGHGNYTSQPYLYFANPVKDIRIAMCVETCPESSGPLICLYDKTGTHYDRSYTKFCYVQMQARLRSKYCRPYEPKNRAVTDEYLESFDLTVKRYASDINLSSDAFLAASIVTVLISLLFSYLIKKDESVSYFVNGIFFLTSLCFSGLAFMFYREYTLELEKNCFTLRDEKDCVGNRGYAYRTMAILTLVCLLIYLIVLTVLQRRLQKIIGFLKITSQIVQILQQIRWLPFQILGLAIVFSGLTLVNIPYGLSVADVNAVDSADGAISGGKVKVMQFSGFAYFIAIYDFFIFIVWMLFLLGFRDTFISYCLSIWFFTKKKDTVDIPKMAIFKNILRYHIGTIAMYALISTVITLPKLIIMNVRKILRVLPQYSNPVRYFQATCNTCLFAYEKFLRYFSKHSLVQVSITSKDFYPCSKIAYFLLFRNRHKISDMDQMQEFVVNNVKFCCAFLSGLFVYVSLSFLEETPLSHVKTEEIENKVIPAIVMSICGYFFSAIFQGSYDITCKTVIQCYLIDEEIFYGENRYVEPFIKNVFEYYVKEDLDKYKFDSKDGVKYDEEKAAKAKEDVSDDDKSYNSEEAGSGEEDEEKKKEGDLNDSNPDSKDEMKPNMTATSFKVTPVTSTMIPEKPATLAAAQAVKLAAKEQPEVSLINSNDGDDNGDTTYDKTVTSKKPTYVPSYRYPTKNVGMKDYAALNTSVSSTGSAAPINGLRPPSNQAQIRKPPTPTTFSGLPLSYQRQNPSSNLNIQQTQQPTVTKPGSPFVNPTSSNRLNSPNSGNQFNSTTRQIDNTQNKASSFRNIPANNNNNNYNRNNNNNNNNDSDDSDEEPDDFGFGANPFSMKPNNQKPKSTQQINLNRGPNKNDIRLINGAFPNQSSNRGRQNNTAGSSKFSKSTKQTFDPFTQFEKNVRADSDDSDDDDDDDEE